MSAEQFAVNDMQRQFETVIPGKLRRQTGRSTEERLQSLVIGHFTVPPPIGYGIYL